MKLTTKIVLASALFVAPLAMANPFMSQFFVPSTNSDLARGSTQIRTEARFSSSTSLASGKAKYREKSNGKVIQQRFSVEVEDAGAGEEFTVMVNGAMFGTIIANDLGVAELQFRTAEFIDEPGDGTPIPTDFPRIDAGAKISVGGMNGVFEAR